MSIDIRLLARSDERVLDRVAPEVFDHVIDKQWTNRFFTEPSHHIVVAIDDGVVVGMATAVDYVHPDKPPQLWINELGVGASHRGRGIAKQMLARLLDHGRELGCTEAWLGTEETNEAARRLYVSAGGVAEPFILYSFQLSDDSPK
jgi:ribosomal protein S18 acetylase RimI-like enzyme